jgi:hypothetical protein
MKEEKADKTGKDFGISLFFSGRMPSFFFYWGIFSSSKKLSAISELSVTRISTAEKLRSFFACTHCKKNVWSAFLLF